MAKKQGTLLSDVHAWKFVTWDVPPCPKLEDTFEGNYRTVEEFLARKFSSGWVDNNIISLGGYKLRGWFFDLRPWLKKYLVKQWGHIQEYYAPNKTTLRKILHGRVDYIQELTVKEAA
jgi:hypothetical protein